MNYRFSLIRVAFPIRCVVDVHDVLHVVLLYFGEFGEFIKKVRSTPMPCDTLRTVSSRLYHQNAIGTLKNLNTFPLAFNTYVYSDVVAGSEIRNVCAELFGL